MGKEIMGIVEQAAICAHELNRAYCMTIGDNSQPSWADAPDWQKDSAREGARKILDGEVTTPEQSHLSWMAHKLADGWQYGPVKDPSKKEHPCMVPYEQLEPEQRVKDALYHACVRTLFGL
jgi:hypothetical protein